MPEGSAEPLIAYRPLGKAESLLLPLNTKPFLNQLGTYRLFRPQADKLDELTLPKPKTDKDVTVYHLVLTSLYDAELDVKSLRKDDPFSCWHGPMKRLVRWHGDQVKQAKKVHSYKILLERSSPLDGAVEELNLGILRLSQVYKKGLYDAYQRQMAWDELWERFDRAKTAIGQMKSHIDGLKSVAKVAEDRLAALQDEIERTVTDWLLKDMQEEIDSYGAGIEAIKAIIKEHQQDAETVLTAMEEFKMVVDHAFQRKLGVDKQLSQGAGRKAQGRRRVAAGRCPCTLCRAGVELAS